MLLCLYSFQANKCWDQLELLHKGQEWAEERQIFGSFSKGFWVMSCSALVRWNFMFFSRQGKSSRFSVIRIWMANSMCAHFCLSVSWEDILITGENFSLNTFLICAPLCLILLPLSATSQHSSDLQVWKWAGLETWTQLKGIYENWGSVCTGWDVENHAQMHTHSCAEELVVATPALFCSGTLYWWVPAVSSVMFCGESKCLCPGEDRHGKQEPQTHADVVIAHCRGLQKLLIIGRWRQLKLRSES